jgi:alpha-L-fucosidase
MLGDIVSKNGNLLINVVQTPEGDLEPDVLAILDEIGKWTPANGVGIYGSRPWKIFGEGPLTSGKQKKGQFGGLSDNQAFSASDIRFTTKGGKLYAYCMGKPTEDIKINALGKSSKLNDKAIASIKMLGSNEKIKFNQEADALVIAKPAVLPDWKVVGFEITFKK